MIFVLESFRKNREAKVAAWEKARDEWVSASSYRSRSDYGIRNPRPGIPWEIVARLGAIAAMGAVIIALLTTIIRNAPTGMEVDKSPSNPKGCHVVVNKGDKVAVQGGDLDGSEGTVIQQTDNCSVDLRLTKSTYTRDYCLKNSSPGYCDKTKENDTILNVENSKQIIKL
jgi:hypothetical protein